MSDLLLIHRIFEANNKSYLKVSKDYLKFHSSQFIENYQRPIKNKKLYFENSSHHANAEWLLFNSIYISLFALFENQLFHLVKTIEKKGVSNIKLSHLKGNGINLFFTYFELVGEILVIDRRSKDWQKLNLFIEIRNRLVHVGGVIESKEQRLESTNLFKLLTSHKVKVTGRGNSGQIRIRELAILKSFSDFSISISKKLTKVVDKKFK